MSAEKVNQLTFKLSQLQQQLDTNLEDFDKLDIEFNAEKEKTTKCVTSLNDLKKKHTEEKSNLQKKFNEEIDVLHAKHAAINQQNTKKINELKNEIIDLKQSLKTSAAEQKEKSPSPKKRNSQMSANKRTELELELDAAQSRISEAQSLILELKEANNSLLVENQSLRDDLEVLSQPNIKKMSTTTSAQGEALGLDFFKSAPKTSAPKTSAPKTSAPKTGGPKTSPAAAHAQVENVKDTNVTMLKGRRFPEKGWKHNLHEMVTNFFKPEDYCSRHNNEESRCEDKKPDCVFVSSTEPLNKGDPNKCYDLTTYNFLKHRNVEEQYAASIKKFKKKGGNHKKSHTLKNKRLRPRSLRRYNTRKKLRRA